MAAATTTTTSAPPPPPHEEDADLIAQLAKLQQMHHQISDLRNLLPSALIGPAREATTQSHSSSRRTSPSAVAAQISKAAFQGRRDLQDFGRKWTDDKTKQVLKDAAAANVPQGVDAWLVDYRALAKAGAVSGGTDGVLSVQQSLDTLDEAKAAIENFSKSERNIKVQLNEGDETFPLNVEVARMAFRIVRRDDSYAVEPVAKDKIAQQVREQIEKGPLKKLEQLLESLEAYHDIRTHKCEKCRSLVDANFDMPLIRRREARGAADAPVKWLAYHTTCIP